MKKRTLPDSSPRISNKGIEGRPRKGPDEPDKFDDVDNPVSSTDHGLSNYDENYPDGTVPSSGPQAPIRPDGKK